MFSFLDRKKKLKEDVVANIFVNSITQTIEDGFPEVIDVINESVEFSVPPNLSKKNTEMFFLTTLSVNILGLHQNFQYEQADRINNLILQKLRVLFDVSFDYLNSAVKETTYTLKNNDFSKKSLNLMLAKALFDEYKLNDFQDEYFKNIHSPNPVFLKKLGDIMQNFLFNWADLKENNKIVF